MDHDVAFDSVGYQLQIWPGPWITQPVLWVTQRVVYTSQEKAQAACAALQARYDKHTGGMSVVQVVMVTIDSSEPDPPADLEDVDAGG